MLDDVTRHAVRREVDALAPLLSDGLAQAVDACLNDSRRLNLRRHPWRHSGTVRIVLRDYLEKSALPPGWEVGGNPSLSGQLSLKNERDGIAMRVLKGSRVNPNGVPHAGTSQVRQEEWLPRQRALSLPGLTALQLNHLLLLWDFVDVGDLEKGVRIEVVHPVEPGKYQGAVACDLRYIVKQDGMVDEGHPIYEESPEEEDLFYVVEKEQDA